MHVDMNRMASFKKYISTIYSLRRIAGIRIKNTHCIDNNVNCNNQARPATEMSIFGGEEGQEFDVLTIL